jgi:hypothetical protein
MSDRRPPISPQTKQWLDQLFAQHLLVEATQAIAAWARKEIKLSPDESIQFPGEYDPELSPSATVLFHFMESPKWREFIGVKSSQVGFTLAMLVIICWKLAFHPQAAIICLNSREEIKRIGTQRLQPLIRACKAIAQRIPEDEDKMQNLTLYLIGMTIYLVTAQSAGSLANKSVGLVVGDEVDEWPEELRGGESNALDLLRDRIKRVDDAKLVVFSKPKNEDDIIWPEALTGSRHKTFVPCPHCHGEIPREALQDETRFFDEAPEQMPQGYQELVWEQVRFGHCRDEKTQRWNYVKMLADTYYECVHCKGRINESDKPWMLLYRLYIPTNVGQDDNQPIPRKCSFFTSDLYNLPSVPESTLGHLAKEWVSCTTRSQRMRFRRSRLGLPEVGPGAVVKRKLTDILNLQGNYERGHCTRRPVCVLMGVDVQHDCKKWVKVAFYDNGDCEVVDHGITLNFLELLVVAAKPVIVDDWGDTPEDEREDPMVDLALIDEGDGHYTKTVLDFCTTKGAYGLFWPAKGRGGVQTTSMKDLLDYQKNNRHNGKDLPRWLFNDWAFSEELYEERIALNKQIREAKREGRVPPAPQLSIYRAPDTEFCQELTTTRRWSEADEEAKKKRKKAGSRRGKNYKVGDWMRDGVNDFGDALKECFVAWYRVKPIFLGEDDEPEGAELDTEPKPLEHDGHEP